MDDNDSHLKQTIRQSMQEKETDELLEILRKQDRAEWTDEAFEVVAEILRERLGELPADVAIRPPLQKPPTDTYYDHAHAIKIASWAGILSWLFFSAAVLSGLFMLITLCSSAFGAPWRFGGILAYASLSLTAVLFLLFFFIALQGLSQIIYLLMDIQDNTRKTAAIQQSEIHL